MTELQISVSNALGVNLQECQTLSIRSLLAKIPLRLIDTQHTSTKSSQKNNEDGIVTVHVTALRYDEIFAWNEDERKLPETFSTTLSGLARTNRIQVFHNIASLNPNSNYREVSENVSNTLKHMKDEDSCLTFLTAIFGIDVRSEKNSVRQDSDTSTFANLRIPSKILSADHVIYLIHRLPEYTVADCLMYSSSLLTSGSVKTSFILFQVLQFFSAMEGHHGGNLSSIHWNDIEIDRNGWIKVQLPEQCFLRPENAEHCDETESKRRGKPKSLADFLDGWICGEVSNFDYLMFLNKLAGRDSDDPNHHPILPWVSTFDDEHASWRDLTKSKYRLNKGDRQLDIQYAMMSDGMEKNGSSQLNLHQVPHHVPEYISDITYYVYMARRTPKSILCKLVRSYWEPNEYPSSIQRMQEWTPDECIPEFYTDPAVFESLHEDMCDLLIPEWSKDPSDFVEKHRKMLESDIVSKKLHHWIDITFGYKLSGEHAKAEKNVCLPLVDNHTSMRKRGITQLFTAPHPQKGIKPGNLPQDLSKYVPEVLNDDDPIQLPKAFNPMRELDKVETLLKFKMSVWNDPVLSESLYDDFLAYSSHLSGSTADKKISDSNMAAFVCLMVELYLPLETRTLSHGFDIASRLKYCINVYKSNKVKFPLPFQSSMQYFISKLSTSDLDVLGMPTQPLFFQGHPAPTISLMSSRYIHVLPFPNYYHDLHNLLEIVITRTNHNAIPLPLKYLPLISEKLHCTLDDLGDASDCLEILTPFLRQLLEQDTISAAAFVVANFEIVSKTMGEKSTNSDLLPLVVRLYQKILEENADKNEVDKDFSDSAYLVAMYEKEFLLQLSIRVGLNGFLSHIPACLSNALIHKSICDIAETSKTSLAWLIDRIGPTLTSKYIIKHLFRVLSSCFMSANGITSVGYGRVKGCLLRAAEIFGPSFITLQYFPFLSHRIASSVNHLKLTIRHQAAVESSLVAISHLITYLSDNVLMVELSRIINEMLVPAMNLLGSEETCFPGGVDARKALCMQVLHLMALVVVRIGREMSRKHMTSLFRTFFSNFQVNDENSRALVSKSSSSDPSCESIDSDSVIIDHDASTQTFTVIENTKRGYRRVHKSWFSESPTASPSQESPILSSHRRSNTEAKAEIWSTFCAETAYQSYVSFTRLLGGIHMEKVLGDFHDQIHKLSLEYERSLDDKSSILEKQSPNSYHTDIMMVGNQLVVESPPTRNNLEFENSLDFDIISKLLESAGGVQTEDCLGECARRTLNTVPASQLTGNWLAYWEHEIGLPDTDKHIHFNQIELQSFSGHGSAVRCIASHPTEDWFISGGKDKTVKIWSVPENLDLRDNKNASSESLNEKYVYRFHKKTVNYVGIFETEQLVISNDGNVHVWDPYSCQQITTFDNTDVKSGFALVYAPASPSRFALTVTNEADLRVMDFRRKCLAHEYKIVAGTSMGIARAMCDTEGGNRISVGFSTGSVSSLDLRMGNKLSIKPAHESDISAMVSISDKRYLTASSDQSIAIWENSQSNPVTIYKNIQEPVHTVQAFNDEILSGSFANKIYIHDMPRNRPETSDKPVFEKLRNDIFRGVLTSFCILPMKRQLLLASDTGSIKLLA